PKIYDFCPSGPVHRCIHAVTHLVEDHAENIGVSPRFAAVKLIEGDEPMTKKLELDQNEIEMIEHTVLQMENEHGMDRNAAIASMRYDFIEGVCEKCVKKCNDSREHIRSVKIDNVVTNKYLAIPLFIGVMMLIFWLTFDVIGAFLSGLLETGIDIATGAVNTALINYGMNEVVRSLIIDGIFSGVGSVLSFLPVIVVLFFFLSILEDSGYMARVAFVMDKLLRRIGLSGKSIVPMLIGFGCSVPAIMATRTLSSDRDRKMTVLLIPFMSCSAKITIYAFFTDFFFAKYKALVMAGLYFFGIIMGIIVALIGKNTLFSGKPIPFVMELPNYRMPGAKNVLILMWEKAKDFVKKAFTVILTATIIIWFLQSFDTRINFVSDSGNSILAAIGRLIAPVFAPLGFADWRVPAALIAGITAKEAVVSTLEVLTAGASLSSLFTPVSAISFLVFTLLYTPCAAAVGAVRRELGKTWKAALVVMFQCAIAWVCSFAVYFVANLF
ncbi:MAG: ferrous iron transport protein B, partial [Clostridiales bacterium]|nr:ferrous iron transport protein B [Clostridiales bacterium]